MNYNININQLAISEHFPNLDLFDATILSYLQILLLSPNAKLDRITKNNRIYTWVNLQAVYDQLPLLKKHIKSESRGWLSVRLKKLEESGLVMREYNATTQKSYVCFTDLIERLTVHTGERTVHTQERDRSHRRTNNNTIDNKINNLSSGAEKFNEIKAHPVFQQQRSIRFAKLTDEQIISTLDIALVDNKRLSFASCINWLETENSKIKKQEIRQAKYTSKEIFKPYYREYETREAYEKAIEDARHNGLIVEPEPLPDNAGRFWGEVQGSYGSIIKSVNSQTYIDKDQKKNELYNQINDYDTKR